MCERQLTFRKVCLPAFVVCLSQTSAAQELDPFRAPNLSPPIAVIGLPVWVGVPESVRFGVTTELANHYRLSRRVDDQIILDGETWRLRGYLEYPFADDWSVGVDLPYYHQSGGVLDDLVDAWHSAFGLPDGARNLRPEGMLEFSLENADGEFFSLDESGGGLGDTQISIARRVGHGHGWTLRATLKLPTGDEDLLAGSGNSDTMLSALRLVPGDVRGHAASYFFGASVIDAAQPKNILYPVEDIAYAAVLGGGIALGERFGIKAQIDANSAFYDSQLEEIGQTAVQATIGGWFRFNESALFEFAVSEDLHVSTTPDVVFFFNIGWQL